MNRPYVPAGVIPAVLLPFHDDLSIDEARALHGVIERHHGFSPDLTHFAISGLCAPCRRAVDADAAAIVSTNG